MNGASSPISNATTRWSVRLLLPELEHEYRLWDWRSSMRRARIALVTTSLVFFLFVYSDILFFGFAWPLPGLIALRASAALLGLGTWLALRGPPRPRRFDRLMLVWTAWAGVLAAIILPATRPAAWMLHGFIVCTSIPAVYLLLPVTFLGSLAVGVGMAMGYLTFVIATNAELTYMQGAVVTISLSAANLFGAVASRTLHQTQRTSFIQQRALERARREAEVQNQTKSEFLATVSHEIRTPLHGVLGAVQLLERAPLGTSQREHVAVVRQSARGILELVDGILELARPDGAAAPPTHVVLEARGLARELADHVASRVPRDRLVVAVDASLPERVSGDASRIRRVLLNLVDNAIKYGDATPIRLSVTLLAREPERHRVRFAVDNGGPPIPREERAALFEPFVQRAPADGMRRGFGLGLAIARRDVGSMGGALSLEDSPQGRTVFAFELALGIVKDPDHATPASTAPPAAGTSATARSLAVLVVEDDPVSARLATSFLELQGHRSLLATNGPDAVAAATTERFDVILMDVRLPGFDGVEATRRIRDQPDTKRARVPIVATTANAMPEDRERYLAAGITLVVGKPIDFDVLATTLGSMPRASSDTPRVARADTLTPQPTPLVDQTFRGRIVAMLGEAATHDLLALAIETGAPLIRAITDAARREDAPEVARMAHRLASASHSAAFARLGDVAAALESHARTGVAPSLAIDALHGVWHETCAAYAQLASTPSR